MIATKTDGRVAFVTLDRPHKRNALTPAGLDELEAAINRVDAPVVCLRGSGSAFCAGADLGVVTHLDSADAVAFARRGQAVANAIEHSTAVVVAAIDGPACGGGVELTLACDLRVATPGATFAEPGVKLGLFGAWGGTHRLSRIVGAGNALDLSLSGRTVDATEARRMGLVSRVVEDPEAVAISLAENDPGALQVVKERLHDDAPAETQDEREAEAFAGLVHEREPSNHRR